jgi:hypothetical protein
MIKLKKVKKIAFLFLVLDNPNFPQIWDEYFSGADNSDKYSLYIHPKYPEKVTWRKENVIKNLQETAWGFITRAYIELLKEAIKDKDNYKFVTISESCIPIKSFNIFYNNCINSELSWIKEMNISKYNEYERLGKQKIIAIKNNLIIPRHFIKHYARFCLNRINVEELLLKDKKKELDFFHTMQVGDEFFLSVLDKFKYRNFEVIYDDWDYIKLQKKNIKNKLQKLYEFEKKALINNNIKKIKIIQDKILKLDFEFKEISKSPKTLINVRNNNDLYKIKNCKSYFYRKFSKDSNIGKYLKKIINNK